MKSLQPNLSFPVCADSVLASEPASDGSRTLQGSAGASQLEKPEGVNEISDKARQREIILRKTGNRARNVAFAVSEMLRERVLLQTCPEEQGICAATSGLIIFYFSGWIAQGWMGL